MPFFVGRWYPYRNGGEELKKLEVLKNDLLAVLSLVIMSF